MPERVLIVEGDRELGKMMKARLSFIVALRSVTLVKDLPGAMNVNTKNLRVVVVGGIVRRNGQKTEEFLMETMRQKAPGVAVINCSGRELPEADLTIDRDEGPPVIDEHVRKFLFRGKV